VTGSTTGVGRVLTGLGSGLALASLGLTLDNLRRLRVPEPDRTGRAPVERVALLLPVRDEERHVARVLPQLVRAARASRHRVRVVVLDDGSTDDTARLLEELGRGPLRGSCEVVRGTPPPPGWLGKPWACAQLADLATDDDVLVFVDADVEPGVDLLDGTVDLLRAADLDLVSPYPHQHAGTVAERLVQPLLVWSWMSTLPLGLAERSPRPSLGAANGQVLAVDATTYRRAGGHAAVRDAVLEDLALLRAVKRVGGRGGVVDGSRAASCRMYAGASELRAGYAKSLWAAFGSGPGAAAVVGVLLTAYVVPPVAALHGSRTGLVGYLAGVASRVVVARRSGGRAADAWSHPLSVLALAALTADSFRGHRQGRLSWRGRPVQAGPVP